MKQYYMVEFELPNAFTQQFIARIPEQRQKVDTMIAQGIIKSYSLAVNRSKLWIIACAESEFDLMKIIDDLPLIEFLIPSITPLMLHNTRQAIREFSLN